VFKASVDAETAQSINTAAIRTPAGRSVFLVQQASGDEFKLKDIKATQAELDAVIAYLAHMADRRLR